MVALPRFDSADAPMTFATFHDPHGESDLEPGPHGILQPGIGDGPIIPEVLFVPLVGFTAALDRLGQGGGYYDRWMSEHSPSLAIGLAWDAQLCDHLPTEPHDMALDAIVTPTRIYGHL